MGYNSAIVAGYGERPAAPAGRRRTGVTRAEEAATRMRKRRPEGLRRRLRALLSLALALCLILPLLVACQRETIAANPANYGYYGMRFARRLAAEAPYRAPYSEGEAKARQLIEGELEALGYRPTTQPITRRHDDGTTQRSENIMVQIRGRGFIADTPPAPGHEPLPTRPQGTTRATTSESEPIVRREVIIAAHYDDHFSLGQAADYPDYDGIHESAASVASLLVLLRQLQDKQPQHDVTVAFLGAGNDGYRGARTLLESIDGARREDIDCVYVLEGIYAGDKLYAHAGRSAIDPERRYAMRRKLYEATDVALESRLRALTGVDLLTNQGGYNVLLPGGEREAIYREFTLRDSDYLPFDEAGIPVVFFESAEYNVRSLEEVIQSRHPAFSHGDGILTGSNYDSTRLIEPQVDPALLRQRINVVAFLLLGALDKGSYGYRPATATPTPATTNATTPATTRATRSTAP